MNIDVGDQLFLLRDEPLARSYLAVRHQLASVSRVTGDAIRIAVASDCRWSPQDELVVTLDEIEDPNRFLWLREQVIDGLGFSPVTPGQGGFYWFLGKACRHSKLKLHTVKVLSHGPEKPLQFWFDGEMQFSGGEFTMCGLWAPQWRPSVPGIGS